MFQDLLNAGIPIPHASNAASAIGASVVSFSATSAANYSVTVGTNTVTVTLNTNVACIRFVDVYNVNATQPLYVNVGNTNFIPPAPGAGCYTVPAGATTTFPIPGGGVANGTQGFIKVLSTANGSATVTWRP